MTFDGPQLSLTLDGPPAAPRKATIEERFAAFDQANPHVFALLLELARRRLTEGATWIGVKELWEGARRFVRVSRLDDTYKLNNTFTAMYARKLLTTEPRLVGVMKVRGG